jgi:hypothetical protein
MSEGTDDIEAEDAGPLMRKLSVIGKGDGPLPPRVLVIIVAAVVIIAGLAGALLVIYSGGVEDRVDDGVLVITELEPFNNTFTGIHAVEEGGEPSDLTMELYYALVHPDEYGEIVICFIERISVSVHWYDEPDETLGPIVWENQPDTVHLHLHDGGEEFDVHDEATNEQGGPGELFAEWFGEGTFIEETWRRVDEHEWDGPDGETLVEVTGGHVLWGHPCFATCSCVEAGDQTHPRLPLVYTDQGTELTVEVTLEGYYLSLPPGSYPEP